MIVHAFLDIVISLIEALSPSGECSEKPLFSFSVNSGHFIISEACVAQPKPGRHLVLTPLSYLFSKNAMSDDPTDGFCAAGRELAKLSLIFFDFPIDIKHHPKAIRHEIPLWRFALYYRNVVFKDLNGF